MKRNTHSAAGSALVWTVLVISILSLIAAELLRVVSSKYHTVLHTAVWQESLLAAESGVDLAIKTLRKSLDASPSEAAGVWKADGWDEVASATPTPSPGASPSATPFQQRGIKTVPNAGLAGTQMKVETTVDAPAHLRDPVNSWQYYRVRAHGTMPITGAARAADNKKDTRLHKMSLRWDRLTGAAITGQGDDTNRVTRRVEAIVRPVSAFNVAVMSVTSLDLNDSSIIIDSYDSRDETKSTNHLYDPAKRQENGNIATNGQLINAGNAHVYGDVATNSGTVTGTANITGVQRTDFYKETRQITAPDKDWMQTGGINPTPTIISGTANLNAHAVENDPMSRYVVSSITMAGNHTLTLKGKPDQSPTYIEIYVTGDVDSTGNAQLIVEPGVRAKMYFAGNVKFAGNGVVNTKNQPGDLQMYGLTPPSGTTRTFELGGNAVLSAAVYAPEYDVQINNGGVKGSAYGSFVGKTVKMTGVTDLHYDEALASGGLIADYKIVSWFEDTR